jgi:tyrosyl-tRNA synthetase
MKERSLSEKTQIESNAITLTDSIQQFFSRATEYALEKAPALSTSTQLQVVNNLDWLKELNLLDFLRSTGIHFRVNHMLARDRSVALLSYICLVDDNVI